MTREEEINKRLAAAQCTSKGIKYIMDAKDMLRENAEDDIHYLLARNEELQRRANEAEQLNRDFLEAWNDYELHPGLVMAYRNAGGSFRDAFATADAEEK